MSDLFQQTQELARLSGLLSIFDSYVHAINGDNNHYSMYMKLALKIQLEELKNFEFKHYQTEFKTTKKQIQRIFDRKSDPELKNIVEHKFYSASNKIYQEMYESISKNYNWHLA
ncbi:1206_t:CDS:1 [Cetraspora pellucida]|uniref:1206_t:CDS:1 n=1 Tax=Cetraspora pellucida TaxID=1433469 RepID=A0A9N9K923_9GLOM|nr:1206_t:CDS:1 [Cetraspora pellucida]